MYTRNIIQAIKSMFANVLETLSLKTIINYYKLLFGFIRNTVVIQ